MALTINGGRNVNSADPPPAFDLPKVIVEAETALLSSKEVKWWGVPNRLGRAIEEVVLVRAAAGMANSDRGLPKMMVLGSRQRAWIYLEKILREYRVNGVRPDVTKLTPTLFQAGELSQRSKTILRFLGEAASSADATAAAQWFEIAYADELSDNGYILGFAPFLGVYTRSLSDTALREWFPKLAKIEPVDDLLKSAGYWRLTEGDLRTTIRLFSLVSNPKDRSDLLSGLTHADNARLAKSVDDLLLLTIAVSESDEVNSAANLWTISDSLLRERRYDFALALMESIPQHHPPLAKVAGIWAKELLYRTGDIQQRRIWLDSLDTPASSRTFLCLSLAEHELLQRRPLDAAPLLNQAKEELARLAPEDRRDELELYADILDAVRNRPDAVLRMVAANEHRQIARAVRLCRDCGNDAAANAILHAAIEADKSDDKDQLEDQADDCSEAGDGISVTMIIDSLPKGARESMVPDELIRWGRKIFIGAGAPAAIVWPNSLTDPIERGCALIGIAQAMIIAREPSYTPP